MSIESGLPATPQNFAFTNASSSGQTQVVAAQGAGIRIRVLACVVISSNQITVKFQSNNTDISSGKPVASNGGFVMPENDLGWFQTNPNEALNINLSGISTLGCDIVWTTAT
jgi:hypothetical protein